MDSDDDNCLDGRDFDFDAYINKAGTDNIQANPNPIPATPANLIKPAEPVPKKPKGKFEENEQQMIVKTGIVFKTKGLVRQVERRLTLTQQPRLYFSTSDTNPGEYKSDIILTPFVSAVHKGPHKFEIVCKRSGKVYYLKLAESEDSHQWVTKINRVIEASINK